MSAEWVSCVNMGYATRNAYPCVKNGCVVNVTTTLTRLPSRVFKISVLLVTALFLGHFTGLSASSVCVKDIFLCHRL